MGLQCQVVVISSAKKPFKLVFGSPVRSQFLTPRVLDHNCNRSIYFRIPEKTGPNRCGPVHIGFLRLQNRLRPVLCDIYYCLVHLTTYCINI